MPDNLRYVPLSELADVNPSTGRSGLSPDSLVSFIPMADVSNEGEWINRQERRLQEVEKGYTAFQENDVLFAKITPCTENGKGAHAIGLTNGIGFGSTEFHVLRPKHPDSGRFLFHWSQSEQLRVRAASVMTGSAGQQRVPAQFFDEFEISLLPLPEQRRITEILDAADEAIRQTEWGIAKLRAVKAGLLHDLLTRGLNKHSRLRDPQAHPGQFKDSPLGRIPREWRIAKLATLASIRYGISTPIDQTLETGVPTVTLPCVSADGDLALHKDLLALTAYNQVSQEDLLQPGDLLFNWRSGSRRHLGKTAYFDASGEYTHIGFLLKIRTNPEVCNPRYLWWRLCYMKSGGFFLRAKSQVNNTFNSGELAAVSIILPPIDEQLRIVETLDAHDARICAEEATLEKLRQVKRGLMDDLLTGRVRVNPKQEAHG